MIQTQDRPLADPDLLALRRWLQDPQCLRLRELLANHAAAAAADAANLLCESDPKDREDTKLQDAQAKAAEAQKLDFARKLLERMAVNDYRFVAYDIRPTTFVANNPPE